MSTFRVWFKDNSARLVDSASHADAAKEAAELAHLENAPAPDKGHEDYPRYLKSVRVSKTENLDDGTVKAWK
jgi:hypothetical protein